MKTVQNLMVGTLFFGALFTVAYFTIFSDKSPLASRGNLMVLYFDNADGIKAGSKVTVLGVPCGTVSDVALVAVDRENNPVKDNSLMRVGQKVAVTIEVKNPIIFYENYKVSVKSESLLSDKLIAVDPGTAFDRHTGKTHHTIKVFTTNIDELHRKNQPSALAMSLAMQREATADEKKAGPDEKKTGPGEKRPAVREAAFVDLKGETSSDPIAGISKLIEENRENVKKTINNIAEITIKINRGQGTVGRLVNDDELHRNANLLLTDAQVVIKELRESLEDTREQAPVTSFIRAVLTAF